MPQSSFSPQAEALFVQAERRAERTISMLRMLIAFVLGTAFVFSVETTDFDDSGLLLRQWVFAAATIAAYLLLGVTSYIANLRGFYRAWVSWVSVTGDVAFLLAGTYFGLVNTGLGGNFLSSMPSIWLIPVVLGFGALRFNPSLQAYQIFLLVAGLTWIGLIGIGWDAGLQPRAGPVLNYFFASPPNLMRLSMVLLAGVVLTIAAVRTRALLARAIAETQRSWDLTRFLPQEIADRIKGDGLNTLRRGRRQNAAVMFVDIRKFTQLSETMSPEALGPFVTEFRRRVARSAAASSGTIDKFIGDAAMVVFGLIESDDNDAANALRCATLILKNLEEWNGIRNTHGETPVAVGIGIHYGEVFCGVMGDDTRLEYTVLGDTVNVAARLQDLTKEVDRSVVISDATLSFAGGKTDASAWQKLPNTTVRGRSGEITLHGLKMANLQ